MFCEVDTMTMLQQNHAAMAPDGLKARCVNEKAMENVGMAQPIPDRNETQPMVFCEPKLATGKSLECYQKRRCEYIAWCATNHLGESQIPCIEERPSEATRMQTNPSPRGAVRTENWIHT